MQLWGVEYEVKTNIESSYNETAKISTDGGQRTELNYRLLVLIYIVRYPFSQLLRRLRQKDCLSPRVQEQPGPHCIAVSQKRRYHYPQRRKNNSIYNSIFQNGKLRYPAQLRLLTTWVAWGYITQQSTCLASRAPYTEAPELSSNSKNKAGWAHWYMHNPTHRGRSASSTVR